MPTITPPLHYLKRPSQPSESTQGTAKTTKGIVLIHGYGSNEQDLFSFAPHLPKELIVFSLQAPIPMQPYGNAWYDIYIDDNGIKSSNTQQALYAKNKIIEFIRYVKTTYHLDEVSLLGFSQGAILSYAVALSYPHEVKNILALSGYLNRDLLEDLQTLQENNYKELSIYASHGVEDQVIPIDLACQAQETLNALQIENQWHEYSAGHGIAPENFQSLLQWLSEKI